MGSQDVRDPVVVDGKLVTTDLVKINLGIRILLGSSYYEDWESQEMFVRQDPLGNPVDRRHPWNQHTNPKPQKRDLDDKYSWVMSPRWFDGKDSLALDTAAARWHGFGPPPSPDWSTSATSSPPAAACRSNCRRPPLGPGRVRVEDPAVEQHFGAQPRANLLPGVLGGLRSALR